MNKQQIYAWAGMVGAALFVLTFTLEGWYRPDYKPFQMFISELALGPRGWIQNWNSIIYGLLLLVFSRGVAAEFPNGKASRSGLIILILIAVFIILTGIFVMDPVNTPGAQMAFHGIMHNIVGMLMMILLPICCFVYLRRFLADPKWQFLRYWTLAFGILSAYPVLLIPILIISPASWNFMQNYFGFNQRIIFVSFSAWIFVFALGMLKQRRTNQVQ
jgi:hypothetical membrane protein